MANARHAMATSYHLSGAAVSATPPTRETSIRCFYPTASLPLPPTSRLTRRRNHLRQKLLKTLKQPPPDTVTSTTPQELVEEPANPSEELELETGTSGDEKPLESANPMVYNYNINSAEELEDSGSHSLNESASIVEAPRLGWRRVSGGDVVRYCAYFVGFYFTVSAVMMVLGSSDEEKMRTRNGEKMGRDGVGYNNAYDVGGNSSVINGQPNDVEIEAKIAQIQIMAREARDNERRNSVDRDSGLIDVEETDSEEETDDEAEDDSSNGGSEIEKEVAGRLSSVTKKLNSAQATLLKKPQDSVRNVTKEILDKNADDAKKLSFRKSYKFRSNFTPKETNHKPKGFGGSDMVETSGSVTEKDRKSWEVVENGNGHHVNGKSSVPPLVAPKSVESMRSLNSLDDKKDDPIYYTKGKSIIRRVGTEKPLSKRSDQHPNNESDLWWHSLPYLLVIVMTNGSKDQGRQRGFYTLESSSEAYTVLFEDQIDAKNFCHIVESYFEELGDVTFSVLPLPIKTLMDVMKTKSQATNVIVVKKGQLKLYAGQPLAEVENALRSLVK